MDKDFDIQFRVEHLTGKKKKNEHRFEETVLQRRYTNVL